MSSNIVRELKDRWIVNARQSVVSRIVASPRSLQIELDSGLWIDVSGSWRATACSSMTGSELNVDDIADLVGCEVLSLVLFSTGSIRIVLSTGETIVAKADDGTRVTATLPGTFMWEGKARSVTHWLAEGDNDG